MVRWWKGQGAANESLLTGESDAIGKSPGDELLSGSYLMEGRLVYRLTRVGAESYAGRLIREAKAIKPPKSVLMTDLNRLVRLVSMLLCPLGLLLFLKQFYLSHIALTEAVPTTVAAMIGMIPEGLILLTSVALAVGVVRLGGKGTLVQELYGIETLARVDTLCLDKTGTLTKGEMAVERLEPVGCTEADMRRELGRFLSAFDDPTPTLEALRRAIPPVDGVVTGTLPFSSARKKSAVAFDDGTVLVLGAPSFVMEGELPVPVRQRMEAAAGEGLRVLLLARAKGALEGESISAPLEVLGLCCLSDVIRENAADTLAYFRRQGVTVKVISGDDPRTVAHIARRVGLEGWENAVDATTLGEGAALAEAAERYTIFGRVTPAQKRELVEAMKAAGHSVAMTGDGVNDIPALKAADCSIAMAGGSDAAKNAAQLTLMNADFAAMPAIVGEGRRVINNITRAASLFLVKNAVFLPVVGADAVPAPGLSLPAGAVDAHQLPDRGHSFLFSGPGAQPGAGAGELFGNGASPGAARRGGGGRMLRPGHGQRTGFRIDHGCGQYHRLSGNGAGGIVGAPAGMCAAESRTGGVAGGDDRGAGLRGDPGGEGFLPGAFAGNGRVDHPGAVRPGAGTDAPGGRVDETRGKAARGVQSDGLRACGRSVKRGGH